MVADVAHAARTCRRRRGRRVRREGRARIRTIDIVEKESAHLVPHFVHLGAARLQRSSVCWKLIVVFLALRAAPPTLNTSANACGAVQRVSTRRKCCCTFCNQCPDPHPENAVASIQGDDRLRNCMRMHQSRTAVDAACSWRSTSSARDPCARSGGSAPR